MAQLTHWIKEFDNVKTKYHKFGGIEFLLDGKEVCHIHGDGLVDVKLSKAQKEKFLYFEKVENHHVLPKGNMISYQITKDDDLELIKNVITNTCKHILENKQLEN